MATVQEYQAAAKAYANAVRARVTAQATYEAALAAYQTARANEGTKLQAVQDVAQALASDM